MGTAPEQGQKLFLVSKGGQGQYTVLGSGVLNTPLALPSVSQLLLGLQGVCEVLHGAQHNIFQRHTSDQGLCELCHVMVLV